ncbi:hypothetical protein FS749_000649 [Ceratobasidium sp. UAMH 11750]|nr:hypothetical protein FS749_000649 [Ceratobasidium sp. UAMH 11750]
MPPKKKTETHGRQAKLAFGEGKLGIKKASKTDPSSEEEFGGDQTDTDGPAEVTLSGKKQRAAPETSHLPPIASIPDMFVDIVHRTPELEKVANRLGGRPLRVATMCSGTESPLLALGLVSRAMGNTMTVEHVFSCEIEPFKQAYIERNFSPPLLFRDVCELGRNTATTAYGALAGVPGNVDLLVAGTSCVDFSNLNNARLGIDAGGESSNTFHGMLSWVKRHRPPIVILENVCSAPWTEIVRKLEAIDYAAQPARFDTKQYYIPHTRTRGYCIALDTLAAKSKPASDLVKDWLARVKDMARPASAPLDAFLLEGDDPRIWTARAKMVQDAGVDRRAGKTDWGRCEGRHQKERFTKDLGTKRPMTGWDESKHLPLG